MTRTKTQAGYLIRNLGTSVQVMRPGEKDPAFIVPTVPEALKLVEIDKAQGIGGPWIRCPDCTDEQCECLVN